MIHSKGCFRFITSGIRHCVQVSNYSCFIPAFICNQVGFLRAFLTSMVTFANIK